MELLLVFFLGAVALILLDATAQAFGVDSRTGSVDPRQPARGIFLR
ncbi:MAG TPA: hypothetical protein VEY67_02435 [Candidatus Dormibacteraeota bacterium]|nr:hypothetical protein [Candidatus Dormibacteraeota bacterium]